MDVLGSETSRAVRRELHAATARLEATLRGRDWSARALRDATARITSDAVIALYGRVLLHHDRIATPSGTFALSDRTIAGVESARVIAISADPRLALASEAARRAKSRQVFLYLAAPEGAHLEPCKPDEHIKARVFASRVTSAVRTLEFDVDAATRLRDLATRYELLEGPSSPVRMALAELRALEGRLREEDRLPRRYRAAPEPPPPPPLRV